MKQCSVCGSADVPDKAARCPFCGEQFYADLSNMKAPGHTDKASQPASGHRAFWVAVGGAAVLIAMVVSLVRGSDGDAGVQADVSVKTENMADAGDSKKLSGKVNTEKRLSEIALLVEKAETAYESGIIVGENGCLSCCTEALEAYMELATACGPYDSICMAAEQVFALYTRAVQRQTGVLYQQDVRPELYLQMQSDLQESLELAGRLTAAGIPVDFEKLQENLDTLPEKYANRYIKIFNAFTESENWSRTEAWDLMRDADSIGLVPHEKADDPMTQRYAYALARVTVKEIETKLADGSMDPDEAVKKTEAVLEETDYNPFLIKKYTEYCERAGQTEKAEAADVFLDNIFTLIKEDCGLDLEEDVPLEHFWYFNEFDGSIADDQNGMSAEAHQWIRDHAEAWF